MMKPSDVKEPGFYLMQTTRGLEIVEVSRWFSDNSLYFNHTGIGGIVDASEYINGEEFYGPLDLVDILEEYK